MVKHKQKLKKYSGIWKAKSRRRIVLPRGIEEGDELFLQITVLEPSEQELKALMKATDEKEEEAI